jgi:hypothetical protein
MRNGALGHIPERLLARLWQERAARQEWLRTSGGRRLRVIYPGRPSHAAGPDFRNALLEVEGVGLVRGDVEIHVRQRDWDDHGHANDPNYNGVVLHTALTVGPTLTDHLHSGHQVPVLSLSPLLATETNPTSLGQGSECDLAVPSNLRVWAFLEKCGYPRPESVQQLEVLLERAGDARFLAKSSRFQRFLLEQTPEQTLYEGILEALGYSQNQQSFLQLAARAPYHALAQAALVLPQEQRVNAIESWLLKLSGLGAGSSQHDFADRPPSRFGFGQPMSASQWHCFRIRPANHPRRRIAAAAHLLARFLESGLVAGLRATADTGTPKDLTVALTVAAGRGEGPAYIGLARARDLAVNVVLPLLHALTVLPREPEGEPSYLELYHRFGKLQDNELTREMAAQLVPPGWPIPLNTARRQQGLLHLQHLLAGAS